MYIYNHSELLLFWKSGEKSAVDVAHLTCKLRVLSYRNVSIKTSDSAESSLLLHGPCSLLFSSYSVHSAYCTYSGVHTRTSSRILTPGLHSDTLNSRIFRMDRLVALVDGTFASTHSDAIDALRAFFLFAACTVRTTRASPNSSLRSS